MSPVQLSLARGSDSSFKTFSMKEMLTEGRRVGVLGV